MIGIVTIAYNRTDALSRLLDSLAGADYDDQHVDLIISIDKGSRQEEIIELAHSFRWTAGEKRIVAHDHNLGLRKHILSCGDLVETYDTLIMLEDDITVSRDFYLYCTQAVSFYENDDKIAGISLYAHKTAFPTYRQFNPANNGYDTFLLQYAASWGQCWTKRMWEGFRSWYAEKESLEFPVDGSVPLHICRWNSASWLKYFMWYMAERDLYFVYPYVSRSANHSDKGTHQDRGSHDYMVPLSEGSMGYRFPDYDHAIRYDMYFERAGLRCEFTGSKGKRMCVDLYGAKGNFDRFDILVSTAPRAFKVISEIALKHRPHEMNCIFPEDGNGIYVYDLHQPARPPKTNAYALTRYDLGPYPWKKALLHGIRGFFGAVARKIIKTGRKPNR